MAAEHSNPEDLTHYLEPYLSVDPILQRSLRDSFEENSKPSPNILELLIINAHSQEGASLVSDLARFNLNPEKNISIVPFITGAAEINSLHQAFSQLPDDPEETHSLIIDKLSSISPDFQDKTTHTSDLFNFIAKELTTFSNRVKQIAPNLDQDARWIYDPKQHTLTRYIGPDAHRLLASSRLLGLIPIEFTDWLQQAKIVGIGASVLASTLDLFAALGSANITFLDDGRLEPSNQPRMPRGDFRDNGQYKVVTVLSQLQGRFPYGDYQGHIGRLVPTASDKRPQYHDLSLDDLPPADIWLEAIDASHVKVIFRSYLADKKDSHPILMTTDVGNHPFVAHELATSERFFNQDNFLDAATVNRFSQPPESLQEQMTAIYSMVESDFPPEHKIQFVLATLGLIPYWSQTPISARESSSIAAKNVAANHAGLLDWGGITHSGDIDSLIPPFPQPQIDLLNKLCHQLYS